MIQGETDHYEHVAREAASGLAAVARETGVPVAFGVLTVRDAAQAERRAVPGPENKGAEAARAAVLLVDTLRAIGGRRRRRQARRAARRRALMGRRTKARECAFQILYQWQISGEPMEQVVDSFWQVRSGTAQMRAMAERLALGARGCVGAAGRGDRRGGGELAARPDRRRWTGRSCGSAPTS